MMPGSQPLQTTDGVAMTAKPITFSPPSPRKHWVLWWQRMALIFL